MWNKVENICVQRRNCSSWAISPLATMFSKNVCCYCIKMCLQVGKGLKTTITNNSLLLRSHELLLVLVWLCTGCKGFTKFFPVVKGLNLSLYRRFATPLQQKTFWKHSDKRRNCSKQAISPFAAMFSTFSHRLSIQL